jgi:hypothetical protein
MQATRPRARIRSPSGELRQDGGSERAVVGAFTLGQMGFPAQLKRSITALNDTDNGVLRSVVQAVG